MIQDCAICRDKFFFILNFSGRYDKLPVDLTIKPTYEGFVAMFGFTKFWGIIHLKIDSGNKSSEAPKL